MKLITIDIGGTSIKSALFERTTGNLTEKQAVPTPENLGDFYQALTVLVEGYKAQHDDITGVALSSPGAVNKGNGHIEGASALPYIHHFDIHSQFVERFRLPVTIENDANCAALAEVEYGAAKGLSDVLLVVLGTGVGGSVVLDGKVKHGKHLLAGEFGFMLMENGETFSTAGTAVSMARRYNEKHGTTLSGQEIFDLAFVGSPEAQAEMAIFVDTVSRGLFNLAYAFDPECILIGGGVSQAEWLLPTLNKALEKLVANQGMNVMMPEIATCHFKNDANLIGAAVDFMKAQTVKEN